MKNHFTGIGKGKTNLKVGTNTIKYNTFKANNGSVKLSDIRKYMKEMKFEDNARYWVSLYYKWGERCGKSFDGNNFTDQNLYNPKIEYANANNGDAEDVRYVTIYAVQLPPNAGGDDNKHNDCLYSSLHEIIGFQNKLPEQIKSAGRLKRFLKLDRDDSVPIDRIKDIEAVFPPYASINVTGDFTYSSIRKNTTINFELYLANGHYSPRKNKGKTKYNVNSQKYEFETERDPRQVYSCYFTDTAVHIYNGEHETIPIKQFKTYLETNIMLTKHALKNTRITKEDQVDAYNTYIEMAKSMNEDTKNCVKMLKFQTLKHCVIDCVRMFTRQVKVPEKIDEVEAKWLNASYSGGHLAHQKYEGEAVCYDRNSAYSAVLDSTSLIPMIAGYESHLTDADIKRTAKEGIKYFEYGMYRAQVTFDKSKLSYFNWRSSNYYTHHDLNSAVNCNLEVKLIQDGQPNCYLYDKTKLVPATKIFHNYIEFFYKLKQSKNRYAKIFLNKMTGAMAEKNKIYKVARPSKVITIKPNMDIETIYHSSETDRTQICYLKKDKIFYSNYARISIFMTAIQRLYMRKLIYNIEQTQPNSVVRCHTDSVCVKAGTKVDQIKQGDGLGEFKIEKQGYVTISGINTCKWKTE